MKTSTTRVIGPLTLLSATLLLALPATADESRQMSIDANIEIDTDAIGGKQRNTEYDMGGRVEVNVFGEQRVGDHFVRGRGTALLKNDGEAATDDMWGMIGSDQWDIQVGRFEAFDLFPLGNDTLIVHADGVNVYEANTARGRADDGGQIALHLHPSQALSFELATLYGEGDSTKAFSGIRPAMRYTGQGFTFSAGFEHVKYDEDGSTVVDHDGYGATLGFSLGDALIQLNSAHQDNSLDDDTTTLGANLLYRQVGLGLIHSYDHVSEQSNPRVNTLYATYTLPVFALPGASVTLAANTSQTNSAGGSDEVHGARVRFNYAF